jgi:hypothetical protein
MKKYFLFCLIVALSQKNIAQTPKHNCSFEPKTWMTNTNNYSNRFNTINDNNENYVFNVKFHIVSHDGVNFTANQENIMFKIIGQLNVLYNNEAKIYFKYRGFDNINRNINACNDTKAAIYNAAVTDNKYDTSAINIFLYEYCEVDETSSNFYTDPINPSNFMIFLPPNPDYDPELEVELPMTIGHYFGLLHLEYLPNTASATITNNLPPCIVNRSPFFQKMQKPVFTNLVPENVTRDANNTNYNADIAGDLVADTGACFRSYERNLCSFPDGIENATPQNDTYEEHPAIVDPVGDNYTNLEFEVHNYMSVYGSDYKLQRHYTPGQVTRARNIIATNPEIYQNKMNLLEDGSADTSVLYEPFALSTISTNGGNTGTTAAFRIVTPNETNTGLNIQDCGPFVARYQTGFNHTFTTAQGQIVTQTPFQQYNTTLNGNLTVKIAALGEDTYQTGEPACFSSFEPYIKGEVKTLDHLGSYYLTTQELDAIKATNPDLYNELQSGKYHIIIKETASGDKNQKIIYKN